MQQIPHWNHQKDAIKKGLTIDELALFFETGTGKSRTAIDIMRYKCAGNDRLLRVLIVSPKITLTNWQREIAKFSKIHPRDVLILKGAQPKRCKQFQDAVMDDYRLSKPKIIITNYEAMEMQGLVTLLQDWNPELVIADEAHRIKNHDSVRGKALIRISDAAKYRLALTATPILNSSMDVFNIYRFLDKGATFGTSFWRFRSIWFEDENAQWSGRQGYFPKYVPRPESYADFSRLLYNKAVRAVKSECLDLPPFVRKEIHVELSPEQARLYKEMKDEYIAYIDTLGDQPRAVVAQMAVTKALRLQQIITGYAKDENGDIYTIKKNPRIEALTELLETLAPNHKIIVWSVFHENYKEIAEVCTKLRIGFTELHGRVGEKDRDANIDRFNTDVECRVLIGNQGAGGIGINLIASDVAIYYSKNFSLEHDIQSEARNYRGGSEIHQKVTRIDIVATDTIDELINQALANKQKISDQILAWKEKL
jgi:SNF2 family DNA or RNA helicase